MIKPTIGRVVWYYPAGMSHEDQPWPALICYVHHDHRINVGGFNRDGVPFGETGVTLLQDGYGNPGGSWACWMPYQKDQAAKTEATDLEAALALGAAARVVEDERVPE